MAVSPEINQEFRIECMMCHQQGNNVARTATTREQWESVFARMSHKNAMISDDMKDRSITALLEAYKIKDEDDLPRIPPMPKGKATEVTITEWAMEPGGVMHDIAVGPDGLIYGAGTRGNQVWRLDPETNEREELKHIKPEGNFFSGDKLGLHTAFPGPDGKSVWFTYATGNIVSRYDIATDTIKVGVILL